MGFLLNASYQGEDRLVIVNADLLPLRRHQCPCTVPVIFHHTEHRKLQFQFSQRAHRGSGVVYAAVNQQQIRCRLKALIPFLIMRKSPFHNLVHGSIIILIVKAFHFEAFIAAFVWFSRLKNHHAGNNICPRNVGNIKRFNPHWRFHHQHFSKEGQCCADAFVLPRHPLCLLLRVFAGQFHKTRIIPPLGYRQLRKTAKLLLQKPGKKL